MNRLYAEYVESSTDSVKIKQIFRFTVSFRCIITSQNVRGVNCEFHYSAKLVLSL